MLFNSYEFALFLPLVFLVYWRLGRRAQNLFLVAASYVFYGWWDWRFLTLIVLSSAVDYVAGLRIHGAIAPRTRRLWLALSLAVNLGALGIFKYLDFGIESFAAILQWFGLTPSLPTLGIILPVGISFYTFQTLSYTIDVYRGRMEPTRDWPAFFAFVAFFPQLVAGPIERATSLLPQFLRQRVFDSKAAADGLRQMLYGTFLKVVVADNLGLFVDWSYGYSDKRPGWILAVATFLFAFQIYGDFAGYSHIAIGCARLFGFDLMRNFAYPYFSRSPSEFWHRWHISLSTWFRDYVYIPLGGSRVSSLRHKFNLMVTFIVSGLWHGAGLTFLAWGAVHGLLVAIPWGRSPGEARSSPGEGLKKRTRDLLAMLLTFSAVCLAWVLFRAQSLSHAVRIFDRMLFSFTLEGYDPTQTSAELRATAIACIWVLLVLALEWSRRLKKHPLEDLGFTAPVRWAIYFSFVAAIALWGRIERVPFIYFQF